LTNRSFGQFSAYFICLIWREIITKRKGLIKRPDSLIKGPLLPKPKKELVVRPTVPGTQERPKEAHEKPT
jgi:hypothetical protein